MKNLVKALFIFTVATFIFSSCNKEKRAVNRLEGEWHLEEQTASETGETCDSIPAATDVDVHWIFTAYTVGDQESGSATLEVTPAGGTTTSTAYTYSVNEDGDMLTLTPNGSTTGDVYTIEKLTKSELELSIAVDSTPIVTACSNGFPSAIDYRTVTVTAKLEKE